MALVPAVRAGLPRLGGARLDRRAAHPVLPEPRRHARAAGPGEPGFRPSEERQAHRLPQRRAAGQTRALVAYQAAHGADQQVLDAAQTLALEPALAGMGASLAARSIRPAKRRAIAASSPRHCSTACRAWPTCNARCPIRSRACSGKAAASWRCRAATATSARTRWCWRPASARARCSPLGHDVPLYPLKGYSLTVPLADDDHMAPAISVTDYERRIVYARVGGVLRIAAMVDIGGGDAQIDPERIALLKRQVHEAFPGLDLRQAIPWAGDRPRPGQAADRPQPRRQSVAEHRPGRAGLHAGLRQRGVAERADGRTGTAAGSGAVPALSPGRLDGAARTGMSFCDSDCLFIGRRADPASIGWRFRCAGLAWRSGNRFPFSG